MRFSVLLSALFICSCSLTEFKEWAVPETNAPVRSEVVSEPVQTPRPAREIAKITPSIKEKYSCTMDPAANDAIRFIRRYSKATYHERNELNEEKVGQLNELLSQFVDSGYIKKHYLYKSLYVFPFYDQHTETPEVTCVTEEGGFIAVYVALNDNSNDAIQVNKFMLQRNADDSLSIVPQRPPIVVPKGAFSSKQERKNWSPRLYLQIPEVVYNGNLSAQLQ